MGAPFLSNDLLIMLSLQLNHHRHAFHLSDYMNGWLCFITSIVVIGAITAVIGDLASHFGCTSGIKDSVTAISFVALGTSVPGKWQWFLPPVSANDSIKAASQAMTHLIDGALLPLLCPLPTTTTRHIRQQGGRSK